MSNVAERNIQVPMSTVNALLNYLAAKPYVEVAGLIDLIRAANKRTEESIMAAAMTVPEKSEGPANA